MPRALSQRFVYGCGPMSVESQSRSSRLVLSDITSLSLLSKKRIQMIETIECLDNSEGYGYGAEHPDKHKTKSVETPMVSTGINSHLWLSPAAPAVRLACSNRSNSS